MQLIPDKIGNFPVGMQINTKTLKAVFRIFNDLPTVTGSMMIYRTKIYQTNICRTKIYQKLIYRTKIYQMKIYQKYTG
jgi:predicted small secreted protein